MMPLEEFDSLVEKKFEYIQALIDEKAQKERELCEAFAEAVINLLVFLMNGVKEYGNKEINSEVSRDLFGEYNVNQSNYIDKSMIYIHPDKTVIKLTYAEYTRKRLPEEYNEHLINELLSPYFITVRYYAGEEYCNGELNITYDRTKRLANQRQTTINGK